MEPNQKQEIELTEGCELAVGVAGASPSSTASFTALSGELLDPPLLRTESREAWAPGYALSELARRYLPFFFTCVDAAATGVA